MRYRVSLHFDISGVEPDDWMYSAFEALRDAGLLEYVRGELEEDYTIEAVPEAGNDPGAHPTAGEREDDQAGE